MFQNNGIHVRKLPGFGEGKTVIFDSNSIDIPNMPKFNCSIINKDNMDENLKNKKSTFYSYSGESKTMVDICGEASAEKNIETNIEEGATSNGVFYCPNELCRKPFLQYSAYINHKDSRRKCTIRMPKQSTNDYAVEQYISKNGISEKYQSKSYKDTRNMIFQKGRLPDILKKCVSIVV